LKRGPSNSVRAFLITGTGFPFLIYIFIIVTNGYPPAYHSSGYLYRFLTQLINPVYPASIIAAAFNPKE